MSFGTADRLRIQWPNRYDNLSDDDLKESILIYQWAAVALSTEFTDRLQRPEDSRLKTYYEQLLANAEWINHRGLTAAHSDRLQYFEQFLIQSLTSGSERSEKFQARQFLVLVSRVLSWPYTLLILCALGKDVLHKMTDGERVKMINYIIQHRDVLYCQELEEKARHCKPVQQCRFRI